MTTLNMNSKGDTVLLLDAGGAGIDVDISEQRTDPAPLGFVLTEAPSARAALTAPRELAVFLEMNAADDGVLLYHGAPGGSPNYTFEMSTTFASTLECRENGDVSNAVAIPGLAGPGTKRVLLHWSTRPYGAETISELMAYNLDTGECNVALRAHAARTTNAAWDLVVGAGAGGSDPFVGGLVALLAVRIGRRFHSTTEAKEDWVSTSLPPLLTARRRPPRLPIVTPLEDEGEFAGPVYGDALLNTRSVELRAVGPLVNMRPTVPHPETNDYSPVRYFRAAPDSDAFHWCVRYLQHVIVPPKCNRARVRAHVQMWRTNPIIGTCTMHFRCYSAAYLPLVDGPNKPMVTTRTASATINTDHTASGVGEWVDLGELKLTTEDETRRTYLVLAFSFGLDTGASDEANTICRIKAWTVEPYRNDADQGGDFDLEGG